MVMPESAKHYGSPSEVYLDVRFSRDSNGALTAHVGLIWIGKQPTMIGESSQLLFAPAPTLTGD